MITPNLTSCITRSVKICFCFFVFLTFFFTSATEVHAIPSPELVLGSVSSASQILALVVAALSGFGAMLAAKFGIRTSGRVTRFPVRLIAVLSLLTLGLIGANLWQWQHAKTTELQRLQATLVRPAQFDGTEIKDAELKEISYSAQETHPQGLTTAQASALLSEGTVKFFDIRESAEAAMGTLPGATHIRFPDFRQTLPVAPGEEVVLFCHNGNRSSETCVELAKLGIDCRFIAGGIEKWIVESRPFSDSTVETLSDLRAIPDYPNKSKLLNTATFTELRNGGPLQIVDTRYPGDFEANHLPGAINIPLRALTTQDLAERISALSKTPTVAACYDRRSCFMSQVLGLELTKAGIPFEGRYTVPWEFFVPSKPKPHVAQWMAEQERTIWDRVTETLSAALLWGHERSHILVSLAVLALISRLLVLPIALKSERDQIKLRENKPRLEAIKNDLAADPLRKSRAMRAFYADLGLTPMRNLTALLFLPVMMLGLRAAEHAAGGIVEPFLWISDLGVADPSFGAPLLTCALAAVYLLAAITRSRRSALLWLGIGVPLLFVLTMNLSAAGNLYLSMSLTGLLVQYAHVSGQFQSLSRSVSTLSSLPKGAYPLRRTDALSSAGNKALRLSRLANAGFPVPGAVVLTNVFLDRFAQANEDERNKMTTRIWAVAGPAPCAVRSSASHEDGADQSFAGVFDSVLDVTAPDLRGAIESVMASFASDRAASYQGKAAGHGNILVQEMIAADYAGVLFTQDPQAPGMMLLEWVEGCGEDLVSGRKTPGTARFGRLSQDCAEGITPPPFSPNALLDMARGIETEFGTPQDIEWAFAKGQFYILQSRDITTVAVGSAKDQAAATEWRDLFARYNGIEDPDEVILEQDEMSEVLPRPTPLSFSLATRLWAPGGSLDLASRNLGLPYGLPEGENAHLVRLFGKTYADTRLKRALQLDLSGGRSNKLRNALQPTLDRFETEVLKPLQEQIEDWQAIHFDALPIRKLVATIDRMQSYFVTGIYREAEQINLLAAFAMQDAMNAIKTLPEARSFLMQAELPHSPSSLLANCAGDTEKALHLMGHRAMFDYELSIPRYSEAPGLLATLIEASHSTAEQQTPALPTGIAPDVRQKLEMAIAYQDLKERAKHEALRVLTPLRQALKTLGAKSGLDDLVFQLSLTELATADWETPSTLRPRLEARRDQEKLCREAAPTLTQLTLRDCEALSAGQKRQLGVEHMGGTCVAGSGQATGRVFRVADEASFGAIAFEGFEAGDILVCQMVNPAWLPQIQKAGAVVSSVGGWLSHMAIVAREKDVLMLVGAQGVETLEHGQHITVSDSGEITLVDEPAMLRA